MRLISRVDLRLNGSFADMILIPDSVAPEKTPSSALFVLTNPGQLNIYDCTHFSTKRTEDEESCDHAEKFPVLVPTVDPNITITKLCSVSIKVLKVNIFYDYVLITCESSKFYMIFSCTVKYY
jgi:syntaxin-binding protein 5